MTFVHYRSNPTFPVSFAVAGVVVLTVFLGPSEAYAQSVQVLDTLVDSFQTQSKQWEGAIKKAAISLFWILAAIEFSVSAIFLALQGAGAQTFAAELVKRILVVGIFYFILDSGSSICNAIVESLKQLAFNAGGVKSAPSAIFNSGWNICQKILNEVSLWKDAGKAIVLCLAAFIIIVCFALIAAMMIVTLVEVAIVSYAGIILLGFGGSSFTKDYAVKYLTYAVSVGIKIMMMTLVVSVGQSIMIAQAQNFKGDNINEIIVVIGVAVVFLAVTKALPSMLQSLVMGSSVGSNTTLPAAVGTVAGAGAAAVGAMAGAVPRSLVQPTRAAAVPGRWPGARWGRRWVCLRPSCRRARLPDGLRDGQCGFGPAPAEPAATTAAESAALSNGSGIIRRGQPQLCSATDLCCLCIARPCCPREPSDDARGWLAAPAPQGRDRFPRRGWATSHLPAGWECCASTRTSWVRLCRAHGTARGCCRTQARRPSLTPLRRRDPGNCSFRRRIGDFGPWRSISCPCSASQTASPAESSGDGSRAPAASFAPVSTADSAGRAPEGLSTDSADTGSSTTAARAPASPGSEAVSTFSGASSRSTLDDRSAGAAQTINQPVHTATSNTEPRATEPGAPSRLHGPPPTFMACR